MRIVLIIFFFFSFTSLIQAQVCDCVDDGNCPSVIPANTTSTVCFEFGDVLNSDLSDPNQGVCGVSINFTHAYVWDLEISLTSPAGDVVQLIGPDCNPPLGSFSTSYAHWNVTFVPDSETPEPDTIANVPFLPDWNNYQSWTFAGQYSGTYHPYSGMLEDFNSGSINGQWCLEITNNSIDPPYNANIWDFAIIPCDPSGLMCCDAYAGDITGYGDVYACEGDSSLILEITPNFGYYPPDPEQYGYEYIISENDVILDFVEEVDLMSYVPGTYNVCGLSYNFSDAGLIPSPDGSLTVTELNNDLLDGTPLFCGDITDECIEVVIFPHPYIVDVVDTICFGETYTVGDSIVSVQGEYSFLLGSITGCDSIVNLSLTVFPIDTTDIFETVCNGDGFEYNDSTYYGTSTETIILSTWFGCDSVIILSINELEPNDTTISDTICIGDSYELGDSIFYTSGNYPVVLTSWQGCDSFVVLNLEVVEIYAVIDMLVDTLTCVNDTVILNGSLSSQGNDIEYEWTTNNGNFVSISGYNAVVDEPGEYFLTASNSFCFDIDTVEVFANMVIPDANAVVEDSLDCEILAVTLDGSSSSGLHEITYYWYNDDGNTIFSPFSDMTLVEDSGIYYLEITDANNGCKDTTAVEVIKNATPPVIIFAEDTLAFGCQNDTVQFDASSSMPADEITFDWSTSEGNFITSTDISSPVADGAGTYQLVITNINNLCTDTGFIEVVYDTIPPVSFIVPPDTINCANSSIILNGSGSSVGSDFIYTWTGNIDSGQGTLNAITSVGGEFSLIVLDTSNFCAHTSSVTVELDTIKPISFIMSPNTISCNVDTVFLNGSLSSGNMDYEWGGSISIGQGTQIAAVTAPGEYNLVVTNPVNYCTDTSFVVVEIDTISPIADADPGSGLALNCLITSINLGGSNTSTGAEFTYEWYNSSGELISLEDTVRVNYADTFVLIVTNTENGCSDTDSVVVVSFQDVPESAIATPDSLTCIVDMVELDGTGSTAGMDYEWIGGVVAGQGTLTASVDMPGNYGLVVMDSLSFCSDTSFVYVKIDTILPIADAYSSGGLALNCDITQKVLGGEETSQNGPFDYEWYNSAGELISEDITVSVDSADTYWLVVTNSETGCMAADTVTVIAYQEYPTVDITASDSLTCENSSVTLSSNASGYSNNLHYYWTGSGIESAHTIPDISVVNSGWYVLSVIDSFNFCSITDSVFVFQTSDVIVVDAGPDSLEVDCNTGNVILDGSASPQGSNYEYLWTTLDGNIVSDSTTLFPVVDTAGFYKLTVTNTDDGCVGSDGVTVLFDCFPIADAGADGFVNCYLPEDTLDGSGSSTGDLYEYHWEALSGNISDGGNTLFPVVSEGIYVLQVEQTVVHTFAFDTVVVNGDFVYPVVDSSEAIELNCIDLMDCYEFNLQNTSLGDAFIYTWIAFLGGQFCSDTFLLNTTIANPGMYELTVIDTTNGCSNMSTFSVSEINNVWAIAGEDVQIPCGDTVAVLTGTDLAVGENILYEWTVLGEGEIISDNTIAFPSVIPDTPYTDFVIHVYDTTTFCDASDIVRVFTPVNCFPECSIGDADILNCLVDTIILDASLSSTGAEFNYSWQATEGGNLCGGESPLLPCVDAPGSYTLTILNTNTNFQSTCSVEVLQDIEPPIADAGESGNIICNPPTLFLGSTNTSQGGDFEYLWTTGDGCFAGDATVANAEVECPGTYTLKVTDITNGCIDSSVVVIGIDTIAPNINVEANDTLTCEDNSTVLVRETTGLGGISYSWWTDHGEILAGQNTFEIVVSASGTYYLQATLNSNGCSNIAGTLVYSDNTTPVVSVGDNQFYTCLDTVFILDGTDSSSDGPYQPIWTTDNGNIVSGDSTLMPVVDAPGEYKLTILDITTNCSSFAVVSVIDDTAPPFADAGENKVINCAIDHPQSQLNGTNSATGDSIFYFWQTPTGHFVEGDSTMMPVVDETGMYILTVFDSLSGCSSMDTTFVAFDDAVPTAMVNPDTSLTCIVTSLVLSGAGSSVGDTISYEWIASDGGNIYSGANTIFPQINAAGTYTLSVTDTIRNCTVEATVVVNLDIIAPDAVIDDSIIHMINCLSQTDTLDGSLSVPLGDVIYSWSTVDGSITGPSVLDYVVAAKEGWYYLEVMSNRNGCTNVDSIFVEENTEIPEANIVLHDSLSCLHETLILEGIPPSGDSIYSYYWTCATNGDAVVSDSVDAAVSETGVYVLHITNDINGCSDSTSTVVSGDYENPIANAEAPNSLNCDAESVMITGEGSSVGDSIEYFWTTLTGNIITGENSLTPEVGAEGYYTINVLDLTNGCSAVDSVEVLEESTSITSVDITVNQPDCVGNDMGDIIIDKVYGGSYPYFYSLDNQDFIEYNVFYDLDTGVYHLIIQDVNFCEFDTIVSVLPPGEISLDLGDDMEIFLGDTVVIDAEIYLENSIFDTIIWKPERLINCPGCMSQSVSPMQTTLFMATAIDDRGCEATDNINILVTKDLPFEIPNIFSPNGDGNNDFLVIFPHSGIAKIDFFQIYNRWGNLVQESKNILPGAPYQTWDGTFEGQKLMPQVFVWYAQVTYLDGRVKLFSGNFALVR